MKQFAQSLAHMLAKSSQENINEDKIRYGIEVILGGLLQTVLLLVLAVWLNLLYETAGIILASALYRRYSGGAHCTAYYRCTLTSLFTLLPLAYLTKIVFPYISFIIISCGCLVVLIVAWLKVPVDNPTNPITDPLRRQSLRQKSLIMAVFLSLLSILLLFSSPLWSAAIIMGLLWQSITLTAPGHIYMSAWDNLFLYIEKNIRKEGYYAKQS